MKRNLQLNSGKNFAKLIAIFGVIITLILTPEINKDALVVPKLILLNILAFYFMPRLYTFFINIGNSKIGIIVKLVVVLNLLHLSLVFVFSGAPIEQQLFGRDGRLLGLLTFVSILVIFTASINSFTINNISILTKLIVFSGIACSIYAIFQSYGLDIFSWESRTNLVIGTIGNPNYVSALAAAILVPTIVLVKNYKFKVFYQLLSLIFIIFTIQRSDSIQGYVAVLFSISLYFSILLFYRARKILKYYLFIISCLFILIISGTLGHGLLSKFLYKTSVQSRGDFWRSAVRAIRDNPTFGVGLDSFGDNYLVYRDEVAANHPFAEYTDSAHNYLLDYGVFGGLPLLLLNILIILLTIYAFFKIQKKLGRIDFHLFALFTSWTTFQLTMLISPISIPIMYWSSVVSGSILGIYIHEFLHKEVISEKNLQPKLEIASALTPIFIAISIFFTFSLFTVDNQYLKSLKNSDGNLGIKLVDKFPRSSTKYSTVGRLLLESGENKFALTVARKGVEFNPKNVTSWAIIMINPIASTGERLNAKQRILKLDPFNTEVPGYQISEPK